MGGCTSNTTNSTNSTFHLHRQGNLTFYISGTSQSDSLISGIGCKRAQSWYTDLTKEEISVKIQEFWDTRVDGSPRVWASLKQAVEEPDLKQAASIVKSVGLTMHNGLICQTIDERGHRYDIPAFVLNEAVRYANVKREDLVKDRKIEAKEIDIVFRTPGMPDYKSTVNSNQSVKSVKEGFKEKYSKGKNVRIFFAGRELKDENLVGMYRIFQGAFIQVFMKE